MQEAFGAWTGDFAQLGRHLKNAGAKFDECQRKVDQFGDRVARITGGEGPADGALPGARGEAVRERRADRALLRDLAREGGRDRARSRQPRAPGRVDRPARPAPGPSPWSSPSMSGSPIGGSPSTRHRVRGVLGARSGAAPPRADLDLRGAARRPRRGSPRVTVGWKVEVSDYGVTRRCTAPRTATDSPPTGGTPRSPISAATSPGCDRARSRWTGPRRSRRKRASRRRSATSCPCASAARSGGPWA